MSSFNSWQTPANAPAGTIRRWTFMTSTTKRVRLEPTQLLVEFATTEGRQSGLLNDSAVKCERLHTILQTLAKRTIGSLSTVTMLIRGTESWLTMGSHASVLQLQCFQGDSHRTVVDVARL